LHHDNAPAHTALINQQFLAKNKMMVVSHPPYSPDLTPYDFILYPQMKHDFLKGRHFPDIAEVQRELLAAVDSISIEDFRQSFQ
jgi:histone-lysine N-methyltransferase SETMAR